MRGILGVVAAAFVAGVAVLAVHGALAQGGDSDRPGDKFIAKTAEKLGIRTEALTTAMSNAQFDIIDEAVANSKLTADEAAKLKARVNEYGPLSVLGLRHRKDGAVCRGAKLVVGAAADVLQMDRADIVSALKSGQSLAEIAQSKGMGVDDFKAALLQSVKSKLDAKVADGTITQEQSDRAYSAIQGKIDEIVQFKGGGSEPGPCHRWRDGEKEAAPGATS
ncbi:MAG: hypothetical protein E6I38_07840 [Chloroflexi bacterium]|nr:MAG: hypothetical protein E6I38_07840 [Chloroflexota bacterium]